MECGVDRKSRDINGRTALLWAIRNGRHRCFRRLLYDTEINISDNNGMTPLMEAARHKDDYFYKSLLDRNAITALADQSGRTAEDWRQWRAAATEAYRDSEDENDEAVQLPPRGEEIHRGEGATTQQQRQPGLAAAPKLGRSLSGERQSRSSTGREECTICFEAIGRGGKAMGAGICGHIYCYECLLKWAEKNGVCPTCRRTMKAKAIIKLYI